MSKSHHFYVNCSIIIVSISVTFHKINQILWFASLSAETGVPKLHETNTLLKKQEQQIMKLGFSCESYSRILCSQRDKKTYKTLGIPFYCILVIFLRIYNVYLHTIENTRMKKISNNLVFFFLTDSILPTQKNR